MLGIELVKRLAEAKNNIQNQTELSERIIARAQYAGMLQLIQVVLCHAKMTENEIMALYKVLVEDATI